MNDQKDDAEKIARKCVFIRTSLDPGMAWVSVCAEKISCTMPTASAKAFRENCIHCLANDLRRIGVRLTKRKAR